MRLKTIILIALVSMAVIFLGWSPLLADPTLSVIGTVGTNNSTENIDIEIDNPEGIAAAVFSITYDPVTYLSLDDPNIPDGCQSGYFETIACHDDGNGTIRFAGVRKAPSPSGGPVVLATFTFLTGESATGDYTIVLDSSWIVNEAAGYQISTPMQILTKNDNDYSQIATAGINADLLQIDRDEDGVTDTQEQVLGMSINNPDSDGDGMDDLWEYLNRPHVNPVVSDGMADSDGDGYINLREYIAVPSTDPGDDGSVPAGLLPVVGQDNDIDGLDLHTMAVQLSASCSGTCDCDFNGDGIVDDTDLRLLINDFGRITH